MHVISFGNDLGYRKLSLDILNRIKKMYPSSTFKLYTKLDLPGEILDFCNKYNKGFGYWIWKPYIISHALMSLEDDKILFYVDGRTDFKSQSIQWLEDFHYNKNYDLAAYQMGYLECNWTNANFFEHFGFKNNVSVIETGQFYSGFSLFRKSNFTMKFTNSWLNIYIFHFDLIIEKYPGLIGYDFVENRYDQSAFSLLIKKSLIDKFNILILNHDQIYSQNSLILQGKSHPRTRFGIYVRYNRLLKLYYPIYKKLKYIIYWFKKN